MIPQELEKIRRRCEDATTLDLIDEVERLRGLVKSVEYCGRPGAMSIEYTASYITDMQAAVQYAKEIQEQCATTTDKD